MVLSYPSDNMLGDPWGLDESVPQKPVEPFDLDRALLDCALENIAVRASNRRREAIHDALLLAGIVLSSSLAIFGCIAMWLIVEGRL